jgi:hypothetical protein
MTPPAAPSPSTLGALLQRFEPTTFIGSSLRTSGGPLAMIWLWGLSGFAVTAAMTVPSFWWANAHHIPPPVQHDPRVAALWIGGELLGWGLYVGSMARGWLRFKRRERLAVYERGFCFYHRSGVHELRFDEVADLHVGRRPAAVDALAPVMQFTRPVQHQIIQSSQATMVEIEFRDRARKALRFTLAGYPADEAANFVAAVQRRLVPPRM